MARGIEQKVWHMGAFMDYKAFFIVMALCVLGKCCNAVTLPSLTGLPIGTVVSLADSATAKPIQVLESTFRSAGGSYVLSLEGGPCKITIRHLYSSPTAWLLWVANYFKAPTASNPKVMCTLKLTMDGDLQLLLGNTLIWNSGTTGKGVKSMQLLDSGLFQLLDAKQQPVWQSFDNPEFALLPGQQFRPGMTLVAPSAYPTGYNFSGKTYTMELQAGDLRLYSNFGSGPKMYWSLKQKLFPTGDLSNVAYAGVVNSTGGLGLFKADGSIVYQHPVPFPVSSAPDTYISLDLDGNLRTWFLYKGEFWESNFQVLNTSCDYPRFCGPYGICSNNSTCSCLATFKPVSPSDLTQGCAAPARLINCNSITSYLNLTGYDYVYNQYAAPITAPLAKCKQLCTQDCKCVAAFYHSDKGLCFLVDGELSTIQKTFDATKLAFIKVATK